jgi:nucleotide-binding universal stress UspA family protein
MSIRVVMVPLFGTEGEGRAAQAACTLARRFDGQVVGLFVSPPAAEVVPVVGEGVSSDLIKVLTQAAEQEMARRRDVAAERFGKICAGAGLPVGGAAAFVEVAGHHDEVLIERARVSDVTVVSGAATAPGADHRRLVEAILLGSGRPLLLVPEGWTESFGHRIAIAWNGRVEAARALALAMPLVEAASSVHVLTAATRRTSPAIGAGLEDYLGRHGVASERHEVKLDGEAVGAALLSTAAGLGADLVVMGGYGRSRVSELMMGGVTRHMLGHARLPVLMAH